jgi:hypothetical protein
MAASIKTTVNPADMAIDKRKLQQAFDELNANMGFERDPQATAEEAQERMLAAGLRPEDCLFTRELIQMRYGDKE